MMQPQSAMPEGMPGQQPQSSNTVTIDMTPGAITVTSANGTTECDSIGECLQTVLELYEATAGQEGESELMSGYAGDSGRESRPIGGVPVK